MKVCAALALTVLFGALALPAAEPDYAGWNELLRKYYNPEQGMCYGALKANDAATLKALRARMAAVDPGTLSRNEQLAYWINLYNISVVGIVV
ncbi:MAG TPA: hypothetical protein VM534_06065, partial [Thermoanaerobaculia bacterium]|nr:hypothetical protein [Thermoanaerobaculia bacterium]